MLENRLAQYANDITYAGLDAKTIHLLKRNLLDSYAAICASLQDRDMLDKFERMASMVPAGQKGTDVWGIDRKAHESEALLASIYILHNGRAPARTLGEAAYAIAC